MITLTIKLIKLVDKITVFFLKVMFCLVMAPIWFIMGFFKKD